IFVRSAAYVACAIVVVVREYPRQLAVVQYPCCPITLIILKFSFLLITRHLISLAAKRIVVLKIVRIESMSAVFVLHFCFQLLNVFLEIFERGIGRQRRQWLAQIGFDSGAV